MRSKILVMLTVSLGVLSGCMGDDGTVSFLVSSNEKTYSLNWFSNTSEGSEKGKCNSRSLCLSPKLSVDDFAPEFVISFPVRTPDGSWLSVVETPEAFKKCASKGEVNCFTSKFTRVTATYTFKSYSSLDTLQNIKLVYKELAPK